MVKLHHILYDGLYWTHVKNEDALLDDAVGTCVRLHFVLNSFLQDRLEAMLYKVLDHPHILNFVLTSVLQNLVSVEWDNLDARSSSALQIINLPDFLLN